MVLGRFDQDTPNGPVDLMVLSMRPTQESWVLNVQAWAKQISIEESPEVTELTEQITVADCSARKIRLDGPKPELKDNQSVVAVMIAYNEEDGFVIKMSGPQAAVDDSMSVFDELIRSIAFESPATPSDDPSGDK